jgi:outer membrane protein assembly factor BamB
MKSLFKSIVLMIILCSCQQIETAPLALIEDEPIQSIILPGDYLVALDTLGKVSWQNSEFKTVLDKSTFFYNNNIYSRFNNENRDSSTPEVSLERFDPKTGKTILPALKTTYKNPSAIYDNKVLSNDVDISVSDLTTGKVLWKINAGYEYSQPVLDKGIVYFLDKERNIMNAVDFNTGTVLWQTPTGDIKNGPYLSFPILAEGKIIVPSSNKIIAFELLKGKKVLTIIKSVQISLDSLALITQTKIWQK